MQLRYFESVLAERPPRFKVGEKSVQMVSNRYSSPVPHQLWRDDSGFLPFELLNSLFKHLFGNAFVGNMKGNRARFQPAIKPDASRPEPRLGAPSRMLKEMGFHVWAEIPARP